jgi:phage terminase large subunit-like protein
MLRSKQKIPKGKWSVWLLMAGRGFGKTFAGAAAVSELLISGKISKVALIGKTMFDVQNTMVLNGLMRFLPPSYKYIQYGKYIRNETQIVCYVFSSLTPYILRGFSFDFIWMDEFAMFKYADEIWEQVMFCLRVGLSKIIITTTPKPICVLKQIMSLKHTKITYGSSYENKNNLSKVFLNNLKTIENTPMGRQEIFGELIDKYTLWKPNNIQYASYMNNGNVKFFLGIDPAIISGTTGMILVAYVNSISYVIEDFSSRLSSIDWMSKVIKISEQYKPLTVVLEVNQGGFIIRDTLLKMGLRCDIMCQTATKDKLHRNIPTYLLYEKNLVFHVKKFEDLEWQMLYDQKDRVDALTWALFPLTNYSNFNISI